MLSVPLIRAGQVQGARSSQEDALAYGRVGSAVWAVIADGMGGHRDGAIAAQTAVDTIAAWVQDDEPSTTSPEVIRSWMTSGSQAAATAVTRMASLHEPTPPGTTLLWVWWTEGQAHLLHCGDSRAYTITSDTTTPLTIDMTPAGLRVRDGQAPWAHQNTAPDAHILVSALGAGIEPVFDFQTIATPRNLTLALTSDGLNAISLAEWPALIRRPEPVSTILNADRWSDNASLILLRF